MIGAFFAAVLAAIAPASPHEPVPRPEALVTAESENRVIAVDPVTGRVERRIAVAADPEFVAADRSHAVVVSPAAGAVTVLALPSLRPIRVLGGFDSPHIAEISADRRFAHITDDAS